MKCLVNSERWRTFATSVLAKPLNNAQIVRGVFCIYIYIQFMTSHIPFTKSFTSSEDLVTLLCSRGFQIEDHEKAEQYLENIGYYRLSAYMSPLLQIPKTEHRYKPGATFKQVMMLYRFDKKLRLLMFNEIEKIEIAIRRAVIQIPADMTGDPFWLTTPSYFLDSSKFNETMCKKAQESSLSHRGGVQRLFSLHPHNRPHPCPVQLFEK